MAEYGIKCILVDSPLFERPNTGVENESLKTIQAICKPFGYKYIDYRYLYAEECNRSMFCDYNHLNTHGARVYTNYFVHKLIETYPTIINNK